MAQTIKLKRSSVSGNTPSTSDLELGEVAINTYDGKMFIKKNDGSDSIVEIGGSSGTVTDAFKTIAVSGQTSVVADSATDTLTLVAGTNMSITTNAGGDTITFASTGSSGSATFLGLSDTPANFSGAAGKYLKVNSSGNSIEFDSLTFSDLASTPTTIAGYGITDALQLGTSATTALAGNTSIPSALTDLSISDGSNGQVLQTDGSGNFSFVNQTGGNSFGTIAVSGQSNVVADQGSDTLTLVAGSNVTLTTNASGDSVTIASTGGSGTTAADAIFEEYQFTATSGQTTFTGSDDNSETLSYTANAIQVYLNGIFLDPSVDYTATNGTSIVLAETVDANDYLQVVAYKKKISDGQTTVDTFSGNGSTTAFTLSLNPGDENNTRVFIDGVYQSKSNYSVSGTTLTFATAPPNGTAVEVEIGNRVVTLDTTASIDLPDNVKMRLGTSQDLEIFHDGNNSRITDTGTGSLILRGANSVEIESPSGEDMAVFRNNAQAELYYNNNKKFETTNTGVTVTGAMVATGNIEAPTTLNFTGVGGYISTTGAYALRLRTNNTEALRLTSGQDAVFAGDITANGITGTSLSIDSLSMNGTSVASSGNMTLDVVSSINLDAGNSGNVYLKDDGVSYGRFHKSNNNWVLKNVINEGDIIFQGKDSGGSEITALTLDMSDGGAAFFTDDIRINDSKSIRFGNDQDFRITNDGSTTTLQNVIADQDILIKGNDGGSTITALTLDMSNAGKATFTGIVNSAIGFERGNLFITENEIDVSSGNLTLDVAANIVLDTGSGNVQFKDGGVTYAELENDSSGNLLIYSANQDKDILIKGNDGGSAITALTFDMSDLGTAIFNNEIQLSNNKPILFFNQAGNSALGIKADTSDRLTFRTGGNWNRFILDGSGNGTFVGQVSANSLNATSSISTGYGMNLTNGTTNYLLYSNTGADALYMRDMTNAAMITTWHPNYFQVNKAFYVAGTSSFTGVASFAGRIQPSEHIIFQTGTGYVQFPGTSSRAWAIASQGGTAAPGTNSGTFGFHHWSGSAWSNPINISASGKLGVGTSNPSASLHVVGPAARPTDLASVDTASTAQFQADSSNAHSLYIAENASGALIQVNDGATNSTNAKPLALQPFGGNVGIGQGVTAPTYTLDVQGTARVTHNNSGALFQEYNNGMSLWLDGSNGDFSGGDYFGVHAYSTTSLDFSYAAVSQARVLSGGGFEVLNGGMLRAYRSGNSAYGALFMDTAENLYIRNSWANKDIHFRREGQVGIGQTAQNNNFSLQVTGIQTNGTDARAVRFVGYGNATSIGSTGPTLVLQNGNTTANNYTKLSFETASAGEAVSINCQNTDHSNFYGDLVFNTRSASGYSEKVRLTSTGNFGIGTNDPARRLEVDFTSSTIGMRLTRGDNAGSSLIEFANTGGVKNIIGHDAGRSGFIIGPSTTPSVTIKNSTGNVGIGTDAPTAILETVSATTGGGPVFRAGTADFLGAVIGTAGAGFAVETNNYFSLWHQPYADRGTQTNLTERVRMLSSGRIGIGHTAPNANLHINAGNNTAVTIGDQTNPAFQIGGTTNYRFGVYTDGETAYIENKNGDNGIAFRVKTKGEVMRVEGVSGDWMVGNTVSRVASYYNNQAGCGWRESDLHFEIATTNNRSALEIGRNNANSGDVITIRQQGNSVGMIGTEGGDSLVIQSNGSTGAGLRFHPSTTNIDPVRQGVRIDNVVSLGSTTHRFKDLNLSNTATIPYVRVTGTGDAALASTTHGIQVGDTSGQNLCIDNNEVLSRNNGAAAYLHLQADGGVVTVGAGTTANLTVSGTTTATGGVYLGGTATANKLDDYEEGTWTPAWVATTSYITVNSATYTKIGNLVTLHMYISNIGPATSADTQFITGLPFAASGSNHYGAGNIVYSGNADVSGVGLLVNAGSSNIYFHYIDGTSGSPLTRNNWNSIKSSGLVLIATASYRTDS